MGNSNYVEIFKNPTQREIKECLSGEIELGAVLLNNAIYVWARDNALNVEAMSQIGDITEMWPVMIYTEGNNCVVYVTDAARYTRWYRQPETAEAIYSHPFFRNKHIEEISYWDEDINGKWVQESVGGKENPRLRRCYELSGRYVSGHPEAILVHGELTDPFGVGQKTLKHAWVEMGDEIFDPVMDKVWPKAVYESLFKTKEEKRYTFQEVLKITLQTGNWGPWHD